MIYVVSASGGDYGESWSKGICATYDRDLAEAKVTDLEAHQARVVKHWGELVQLYQSWLTSNPMPPRPKFEPAVRPKKPTPEQRAEYDRILSANAGKNREWSDQQVAWTTRAQAIVDAYRKEHGMNIEVDWYQLQVGSEPPAVQYDIEELPELK